jgi:putative ABC transport system permease protein
MIKHYFKTGYRLSGRQLGTSLVNIFGLATGLAACLMIFVYVKFETGYDKYHIDNDRIFRIEEESSRFGDNMRKAACRYFIGVEVEKMDEVEAIGRIASSRPSTVRFGNIAFKEERINLVSAGLFDVLSFDILEGSPSPGLERPFTVVISDKIRKKYFGTEPASGKLLKIDTVFFEIVGVIKDIPQNSHFHCDIMVSYPTRPNIHGMNETDFLYGFSVHTYIRLKENVDPKLFGNKIYNLAESVDSDYLRESGDRIHNFLVRVADIHLAGGTMYSFEPSGNIRFLGLLGGIGILILIATCLNYMNLSTARFMSRAKEIGIRKTFGSGRSQLVQQFLGESILTVFIAHFIAMAMAEIALEFLNKFTGLQLDMPYDSPGLWIFLVLIILFTALAAGSYPAAKLSSVDPVEAINGTTTPGKASFILRRILIFSQFVISIFLIMATLVITYQVKFMMNSSPGFNKEQKLVFQLPEGSVNPVNYARVKAEFGADPLINGTTVSSSVPGRWLYGWALWPNGEKTSNTHIINCFQVDYDFLRLYELRLIAGEAFNPEMSRNWNGGWLLNESAIKTFGWNSPDEAITKLLMDQDSIRIRGILKDYHFKGLNQAIGPLAVFLMHEDFRYITLSFMGNSAKNVLNNACNIYSKLFPDYAVDYFFMDEDFAKQYEKEQLTGKLVLIFTILAIVTACLGLYGMTAYTLETKKLKYSLFKINGATSAEVCKGILKEFLVLILFAFLFVSPILYFAARRWLMQFPYRTEISIWMFVFPALILILVTIGTISLEIYRIFRLNPAQTMRNE